MIGLLSASIEHIYTAIIFLFTAIFSFGIKKKKCYAYPAVFLTAICIALVNIPFFGSFVQRQGYIVILLIFSTIYTAIFIDTPIIYVMSLLLNLFGCISISKELTFSILRMVFQSSRLTSFQEGIFTVVYILSIIFLCAFFIVHALHPRVQQPIKYWFAMFTLPIAIIVITNLFASGYSFKDWHLDFSRTLIDSLLLLVLLFSHYLSYLNINSYNELIDEHTINQHMALQLHGIETSSALVDQIRRDKHEMKNVYFYIHTLLEENNIDQLKDFVDTKLLHRYDRLEEFDTGNETLDYLLSQKASEARANGISFVADIHSPLEIELDANDLCALLLNLLDNAIEASEKITNPNIMVTITKQKGYLSITVKNRADSKLLLKNKQLLTTKKDAANHGIGLKIVKQIVEKYDGMFRTQIKDGYFTINTMLRLK